MNIGLLVFYLFLAVGLGIGMEKHGKEKKGNHSFWTDLISTIIILTFIWWINGWRFI